VSFIERGVHQWADRVTRGLETGVPLDTAEVVGLAQEIVRLRTEVARLRGIIERRGTVEQLAQLDRAVESSA
jgi:hypothetical protein